MYISHGLPPELVARIVESLNVSIRADLQDVRFWYFVWLLLATGAVVLGVAMEGPEVWYKFIDVIKHRSRELEYPATPALLRTENTVPNWAKLWAIIGWILIVLGVAGEGVAEGYVSWADGTLQTFNDILLGDATKQAASALERAAELQKEEAQLRQETALIEESSAGRRLAPKDTGTIENRAAKFHGQMVVIPYEAGNAEGAAFAWDIAAALDAAKWDVYSPNAIIITPRAGVPFKTGGANRNPNVGVAIAGYSPSSEIAAKAVVSALNACGFGSMLEPVNNPLHIKDHVSIFVAARPIGPQGEAKLRQGPANKTKTPISQPSN
jgi:hypothetical protein